MFNLIKVAPGTLVLGAVLFSAGPAPAQTSQPANTGPYRHVFEQSQIIFDRCGDATRGDLYRKVLTQKMSHCPFSEAEKAEFQAWAAAQGARIAEENRLAHAAGPVPAPADERQCKQMAADPEMRFIRGRLDRYGRGQVNADGVIEEACTPVEQ